MHVKQLDFIFFTESGDGAGPSNQEAGQSQAEGGNAATQQIEIEDDDSSTALAPQFGMVLLFVLLVILVILMWLFE